MHEEQLSRVRNSCKAARRSVVRMAAGPRGCHLGGSLSVVDILVTLFDVFGRDDATRVVLSKGHAAAGLYAVLHATGLLEQDPVALYGKVDHPFTGHPGAFVPGVTFATGSLGHGMAYALGWALSRRLRQEPGLGIAVVGDGELQEGICWECCQIAHAQGVRNFVVVVDCNGGQNDGSVRDISPAADSGGRFKGFGAQVMELNGHDHGALLDCFSGLTTRSDSRPLAVLASTVKGRGVPIEGDPACHYKRIDRQTAIGWLKDLR